MNKKYIILSMVLLLQTIFFIETATERYDSDAETVDTVISYSDYEDDTQDGIKYFIELPNINWQTDYFKVPTIFQAQIIEDRTSHLRPKKYLQIVRKINYTDILQLHQELYDMHDFLECNGPIKVLKKKEYRKLIQNLDPEYYNSIVAARISAGL